MALHYGWSGLCPSTSHTAQETETGCLAEHLKQTPSEYSHILHTQEVQISSCSPPGKLLVKSSRAPSVEAEAQEHRTLDTAMWARR